MAARFWKWMMPLYRNNPPNSRRPISTRMSVIAAPCCQSSVLLRPKVLTLTSGYLSAINAEVVLQPFVQEVVDEVGGSSSVTVLDDLDIVYLAHASQGRAIRLTA